MNKKKLYEKPAMQVFELKQRQQLLQSSGGGGMQDYDWNTPGEE